MTRFFVLHFPKERGEWKTANIYAACSDREGSATKNSITGEQIFLAGTEEYQGESSWMSDFLFQVTAAQIGIGWSDPVSGRESHTLESSAFSRRTITTIIQPSMLWRLRCSL